MYGDFHIFNVWGLRATPALIIGMDVLGTVASLSIDFKNKEIYVASVRNGPRSSYREWRLPDRQRHEEVGTDTGLNSQYRGIAAKYSVG